MYKDEIYIPREIIETIFEYYIISDKTKVIDRFEDYCIMMKVAIEREGKKELEEYDRETLRKEEKIRKEWSRKGYIMKACAEILKYSDKRYIMRRDMEQKYKRRYNEMLRKYFENKKYNMREYIELLEKEKKNIERKIRSSYCEGYKRLRELEEKKAEDEYNYDIKYNDKIKKGKDKKEIQEQLWQVRGNIESYYYGEKERIERERDINIHKLRKKEEEIANDEKYLRLLNET